MYNRYIRDERGGYTRIPQEEPESRGPVNKPPPSFHESPPPPPKSEPPPAKSSSGVTDSLSGILRHFLDRFHLEHVDAGDLLLLGLLFFLFREDADEELLVSLGLLLIL